MDTNEQIDGLCTELGITHSTLLEMAVIHGNDPQTILDELIRLKHDRQLAIINSQEN